MNFFSKHDRFEKTGYASSAERLNRRHVAIIENNKNIIEGCTILDLASHDGRWSFAALKAGASKVIGIEARQELIDAAQKNMDFYGADKNTYDFILGDVPGDIPKIKEKIDVVFVLGFLYHTMKQYELFEAIEKLQPEHIIIDSNVFKIEGRQSNVAAVVYGKELSDDPLNAVSDRQQVIVGIPTRAAIIVLLDYFGYDFQEYDWSAVPPHESIVQYTQKERVTIVGKKR